MMAVQVVGAKAAAVSFARSAATVEPKLKAIRRTYANVLVGMVQARAPRRTGAYAASIGADEEGNVGSDHPASARLEWGFHGVDSLGRRYNQGPQAHYGPGADQIDAPFTVAVGAMVETL
jgi:hypothetical protein